MPKNTKAENKHVDYSRKYFSHERHVGVPKTCEWLTSMCQKVHVRSSNHILALQQTLT